MIPVNEPLLGKNTLKYAADCIDTGWISSAGSYIRRFEDEFARYLGVKFAITTTSGTTALHLALAALGLGPGDEVIVPDHTMIAVPYAVLYTGAKPVLLDVDRETFGLDPDAVRDFLKKECRFDGRRKILTDKRTGRRVRAILPVHLFGHPCRMDEILALAEAFDLRVVEDAAEAHGALYYPGGKKARAKMAGAMSDIGCFSFYANKILTTGEGGMVVTSDPALAERARRLKDLAHDPVRRFRHTELAYNYRMTNVQAAIGLAQLEEIEKFIVLKQKMAAAYVKGLAGIPGLVLPEEKAWARNVYWMYAVRVEPSFGMSRDELMKRLKERGIDTRTFFVPVLRQPLFADDPEYAGLRCPVSEMLAETGFYLPSGLALTSAQIREVCTAVKSIQKSGR
ncbi:MAG: aminotransferase class I/II-fold pyridoxal phosphate-dependent enzyme [Candidatus Aminicenantes bacterium]|nr:aminotransferase class I/II-fold pyridoxal phosphate-dependent enzyme [Candidatus Aminicenantes bacterium]